MSVPEERIPRMTRRRVTLAPVPETPRRALGMVRVSKERERMISPELQRTAISDYAARMGYVLVDWVEGIDTSGSRAKSAWWPRLDQSIERVEAGDVDVILVWKFSRAARNRRRWAIAIDRVEAAGGHLESATEPNERTASGRFARGMLAELAAFEAERIGETWKEVHSSRVARGLPPGGKLPWGWRWMPGGIEPDPEKAPIIVEAYRRYLAGAGIRDLTDWLNASGVRPMHRDVWDMRTITQCLDSPVHAGMVSYRGEALPGAHEGVVNVQTWEAYRAEREARAGERSVKRRYLLSGIALCPCTPGGTRMNGFYVPATTGNRQRGEFRGYRCSTLGKADGHPRSWSIAAHVVEDAVMAWLQQVADDVENRAPAAATGRDDARRETQRLAREITQLDRQLATLTVQLASGVVPEAAYVLARDEIMERRRLLEAALGQAERLALVIPEDPSRIAREALADWDELPLDGRRAVLRQLLQGVVVDFERRAARPWPTWEPMPPHA